MPKRCNIFPTRAQRPAREGPSFRRLPRKCFTLREGFEPQLSPPLAVPPPLGCAAPVAASRQGCCALLHASLVRRNALPRAAVCLPTPEQCLRPCCCRNKQLAECRKSTTRQCAP